MASSAKDIQLRELKLFGASSEKKVLDIPDQQEKRTDDYISVEGTGKYLLALGRIRWIF